MLGRMVNRRATRAALRIPRMGKTTCSRASRRKGLTARLGALVAIGVCLLLAAFSLAERAPQYPFSVLAPPAGTLSASSDTGINNLGQVAGAYTQGPNSYGFIRDASGSFTTFTLPTYTAFNPTGIN